MITSPDDTQDCYKNKDIKKSESKDKNNNYKANADHSTNILSKESYISYNQSESSCGYDTNSDKNDSNRTKNRRKKLVKKRSKKSYVAHSQNKGSCGDDINSNTNDSNKTKYRIRYPLHYAINNLLDDLGKEYDFKKEVKYAVEKHINCLIKKDNKNKTIFEYIHKKEQEYKLTHKKSERSESLIPYILSLIPNLSDENKKSIILQVENLQYDKIITLLSQPQCLQQNIDTSKETYYNDTNQGSKYTSPVTNQDSTTNIKYMPQEQPNHHKSKITLGIALFISLVAIACITNINILKEKPTTYAITLGILGGFAVICAMALLILAGADTYRKYCDNPPATSISNPINNTNILQNATHLHCIPPK